MTGVRSLLKANLPARMRSPPGFSALFFTIVIISLPGQPI